MKVLIEPLLNGKAHGQTVQAKSFELALLITNLDTSPSPDFTISEITFKSAEGSSIINDCEAQSFIVNALNPNDKITLKIGHYGYPGHGLISMQLSASNPSLGLTFYQKDPYSKKISALKVPNRWVDFWYVKSATNFQQERTNTIMLCLTLLLLFLTVLQIFKQFEQEIATLLNRLDLNSSDFFVNALTLVVSLVTTIALLAVSKKQPLKSW